MNFISIQLPLFVRDSINPLKLVGQKISAEEFAKWKSFLLAEEATIRLLVQNYSFTHQDKRSNVITGLISQVITLSNTVEKYIVKNSPVWNCHPQAQQIRVHYLFTCSLFEELLSTLKRYFPAESKKARITHFGLAQVKMELKQKQAALSNYIIQRGTVDHELSDLLLNGITQLINKKNLTRAVEQYVIDFTNLVMNATGIETETLLNLMIINDFNQPEFFLYCVNRWENYLADIPGLHEQREMLLKEKHKLFDMLLKSKKDATSRHGVLYHDLNDFLNEKYNFVTQLVKLRREATRDMEKAKAGNRFLINLPVPQFGLFIRMQIEKGILAKENIGEIFSFFATYFYTANTPYISAESLQKKSTDVEFSTAKKMKGHVIGMLNWLNTNYNLSNYN
ncbi:hypothetical protein [Mucilaginibacter dorajii]|uniref:Uncharacterized protein n=1 Tax=Mucilaginibacter dorajii TaxID=692994 RepID=A0ABP7QXX1_9SPHI|nr:hypothetical protein [Mucilaginibacter dorajii]MCS3732361.1 hypothetical protein [Mucilaginibacter dorajii]